jgi:biotin carboxyl carrier protein
VHIAADTSNPVLPPMLCVAGSHGGSGPIPEPASERLTQVWMDWNTCPPNGSEQALRKALDWLASQLQGDVYLAMQGPRAKLQTYGSCELPTGNACSTLRSALAEAMQSRQICLFATSHGQSSLVLQQLRQACEATLVLGFGRVDETGLEAEADRTDWGLVVCVQQAHQLRTKAEYSELIEKTQRELQTWLQTWQLCRTALQVKKWQKRLQFYSSRQGRLGLIAAGVLLASLALPIPYWPQRVCVVEPATKSFISSPVDGRLRKASVQPGDLVQQGQVLASLDDEQLRWQLSAAEAEYETAGKKRDTALAQRAGGELRLAQLEQERIAIQMDSLRRQLEQLDLRSPRQGVVVQGDWYQSDGAPVTRGDMLFEIAAMDQMRVEIHLTTDDLARIEVGHAATLRVDAAPGSKWSALLERIDPRGQVIDSQVVFAASLVVDNQTNQLRPGMKGTARITAGTQTLGWLLFHRPTLWAMKKLAW